MSLERTLNQGIRHAQVLIHAAKNISFNKRFINLQIFVGLLIFIIFAQFLILRNAGSFFSPSTPLVLLKSDVYASNYDNILKHFAPEEFQKLSWDKKCNYYFDQMSHQNHNWKFDNFDTKGHDDNLYTFQEFLDFKLLDDPKLVLNEQKILELEKEYDEKKFDSNKIDNKIIDAMSTLRIFGKCFIEDQTIPKLGYVTSYFREKDDDEFDADSQDLCYDTEARIFPWLSNITPVFTRWDGVQSIGVPDLTNIENYENDEYSDLTQSKLIKRDRSDCFLKAFKNSINGKGYVISAGDGQVDELKRLAWTLRANGNTLPIQIMHKGDLSEENQKALIHEFRRVIKTDQLPRIYEDLQLTSELKFPKQEVWFVNVRQSIKPEFKDHFQKYANKLLAYLFNSFEEMILIDTDAVPFTNLDQILKFPEYVQKGAYFFKDRAVEGQNTQNQVNYFKRLFPSKLDNYFYNIPRVTNHTLDNRFIGYRRNHFMESGVVVVNRKRHFTGMLAAVQLNFWSTTTSKVHGDKELFWLGLSVVGDENYEFNTLGAASIGELTPQANKRLPDSKANELCSNHPGHIDSHDNSTLLWINSGMTFCKNTGAAGQDKDKPLFKGWEQDKLEQHYREEIKIRAAIVPPPQEIQSENKDGNPDRGWTDEHKYCYGYTWCAYEYIGSGVKVEEQGLMVQWNETDYRWYDFIGHLWMSGVTELKEEKQGTEST